MLNFKKLSFVCVAAAFAVVPLHAQQDMSNVRPAKVWVAHSSDSNSMRHYPAIVQPSKETALSFRVSGQVIELPIRASMQVKEGDVIARVDPRDFEKNIAQLQSQLDQATAQ
ncbi:MAG: biotin/lipoyl-binding protein, partial [Pseudomonadales bacterium]|nr:biotin/lipoyl-binding protein [Pseudomonadales bacterium]